MDLELLDKFLWQNVDKLSQFQILVHKPSIHKQLGENDNQAKPGNNDVDKFLYRMMR